MPEPPGSAHAARTVLSEPPCWCHDGGQSRAGGLLGDVSEGRGVLTPGQKGRVRGECWFQPLSVLDWEMIPFIWETKGDASFMAVLVGCVPHQSGWTGCWERKGEGRGSRA